MLTGIAQLDAEHQDLVTAINRIASAEERHDIEGVLLHLRNFSEELAAHFQHEEEYLDQLAYPARAAHAKHHAETLRALQRFIDELSTSALEVGEIATECFAKLLGSIVKMDMGFLNWQAEMERQAV